MPGCRSISGGRRSRRGGHHPVDGDAVGLAEGHDLLGFEVTGQVGGQEAGRVEHVQDKRQMPRISVVIQTLQGREQVDAYVDLARKHLNEGAWTEVVGIGWYVVFSDAAMTLDSQESDEAIIQRYVEERGRRLTEPVTAALRAAGLDATTIFREGGDPALEISKLAEEVAADVVLLGATRQIFDQSAWESVSARVMIESGRPVLVLPPIAQDPAQQDPQDAP